MLVQHWSTMPRFCSGPSRARGCRPPAPGPPLSSTSPTARRRDEEAGQGRRPRRTPWGPEQGPLGLPPTPDSLPPAPAPGTGPRPTGVRAGGRVPITPCRPKSAGTRHLARGWGVRLGRDRRVRRWRGQAPPPGAVGASRTSPPAPLTLQALQLPARLGRVEEAALPAHQVQRLHQVGAAQVLVDEGRGRRGRPEAQQGQQGQEARPQGHGGRRRPADRQGRGDPESAPAPDALERSPGPQRAAPARLARRSPGTHLLAGGLGVQPAAGGGGFIGPGPRAAADGRGLRLQFPHHFPSQACGTSPWSSASLGPRGSLESQRGA